MSEHTCLPEFWTICMTCGYVWAGQLESCPPCDHNGLEGDLVRAVPEGKNP